MSLTRTVNMQAGDSKMLVVTVKDEGGKPFSLAGYSVSWVLASRAMAVLVRKDTSKVGGVSKTNQAGGVFTVTLEPKDTSSLKGLYYHRARIKKGNLASTVLTGYIQISPSLA